MQRHDVDPPRSASLMLQGVLLLAGLNVTANAQDSRPPSGGIEEIVVTATKRAESIQVVPASISVLESEQIDNFNATQLADYAGYVPGLTVSSSGIPGLARLTLRGIGSSASATVSTYIDEVPLGSSSSYGDRGTISLDLVPYDVEQIEVLRGPQGTLYGASSMGGVIKYVTRDPNLEGLEINAGTDFSTVKGGQDPGWGIRGAISGPLVEDEVAISLSGFFKEHPGFIDNAMEGTEDENAGEQKGGRLNMLWAPGDGVAVKLGLLAQDTDYDLGTGIIVDETSGSPVHGDLNSWHAQYLPTESTQELRLFTATVNWSLGGGEFISASSFSRMRSLSTSDQSASFLPVIGALVGITTSNDLEKYTQEFRLSSSPGERLEWQAGTFYTQEDYAFRQTGIALTMEGDPAPGLNPLLDATMPSSYRDIAAFGDVTWRFSEVLDVTGGLRWSRNTQKFQQTNIGLLFNPADPSAVDAVPRVTASDSTVNFVFSSRYHFAEESMVYARIASGYRPGGPNVMFAGAPPTFDSDTLVNYEVGLKTELPDRRALMNVALYYIDWDDMHSVLTTPTLVPYIVNAGNAASKGVELSTTFSPLDGLSIGAHAAYVDAALKEHLPNGLGRDGDRMPNISRLSASLTADYQRRLTDEHSITLSAGYQYTGSRDSSFASNPGNVHLAAYDILDLGVGLASNRWTARLFARNVLDERAYISPTRTGPTTFQSGVFRPRTVGLSFDFFF